MKDAFVNALANAIPPDLTAATTIVGYFQDLDNAIADFSHPALPWRVAAMICDKVHKGLVDVEIARIRAGKGLPPLGHAA